MRRSAQTGFWLTLPAATRPAPYHPKRSPWPDRYQLRAIACCEEREYTKFTARCSWYQRLVLRQGLDSGCRKCIRKVALLGSQTSVRTLLRHLPRLPLLAGPQILRHSSGVHLHKWAEWPPLFGTIRGATLRNCNTHRSYDAAVRGRSGAQAVPVQLWQPVPPLGRRKRCASDRRVR